VLELMGGVTVLGLLANGICLLLLSRRRHDDINMASVWECSRNDVVENLAVLVAAGAVWLTSSQWPDTVVAIALVALLLRSSLGMIRRSLREAGAG
jgi:Co/Zn/Cd efflux system component